MQPSFTCLGPEELKKFIAGDMAPKRADEIEDHLSTCESCRGSLEATVGDRAWWQDLESALRSDAADGEYENTESKESVCQRLTALLGPTDDPSMLGRIGAYEIIGLLGYGGMGAVFKARDPGLNRYVAIKILLPHLALSGAARARFRREGQAAAAIIDDCVLPIYAVDEWQGIPYLVMQYTQGMSLQKRIHERGPLELKEILRIGLQAARGLAAAHAQGLVHRDVKPSNILLDGSVDRALLTDFGLARAVDDASLTTSGMIAGTPQYMSPEQARAETVDHRSDLFSLGSVMYAMCTGHAPFRAESSYSVLRLITDKEPRPIREINPDVPEWLCIIITKLMAKQFSDRFDSAKEVADLLEACIAHLQHPTMNSLPNQLVVADSLTVLLGRTTSRTYQKMKSSKWIIGSLVAIIVFLVFVAVQSERRSRAIQEIARRELYKLEKNREPKEAGQNSKNEVAPQTASNETSGQMDDLIRSTSNNMEARRTLVTRVIDSESGAPVPGVTLRFMLGNGGVTEDSQNRYLITDDKGETRLLCSTSSVQVCPWQIPTGYYGTVGFVPKQLASNKTEEHIVKLSKGAVWQVEPRSKELDSILSQVPLRWMVFTSADSSIWKNDMSALSGFPELAFDQCSKLTVPLNCLRVEAKVFHDSCGFMGSNGKVLKIEQDAGFDPNHIAEMIVESSRMRITDSSSRRAYVYNAEVRLNEESQAILTHHIDKPSSLIVRLISGKVVDSDGQPLKQATILLHSKSARVLSVVGETSSDGKIRGTPALLPAAKGDYLIEVRKRGYKNNIRKLPNWDNSPKMQTLDVGTLTLETGLTGKITITDKLSKPIPQAIVVLYADDPSPESRLDLMTDEKGIAEVSGLSLGKTSISITADGYQPVWTEIETRNENGNSWNFSLVELPRNIQDSTQFSPPTRTIANPPRGAPIYKEGDPALPLQSRYWIDEHGKKLPEDISLISFKGRSVFMVFTGKWCSACENSKPIYQKLRKVFDEKDVAFLAIHTPEISEEEFEEWVSRAPWFQYATIDRSQDDSKSTFEGESAKTYQVTGFPTVIILDREGRISYSDELMRREMSREQFEQAASDIARELGIKLPLEKLSDEERKSAVTEISTRALSKHIQEALSGDQDGTPK